MLLLSAGCVERFGQGSQTVYAEDIDDFTDCPIVVNGSAGCVERVLRVVAETSNAVGSAYLPDSIPWTSSTSFQVELRFNLTTSSNLSPGDGFTLLLHSDPRGTGAMSQGGGMLGYGADEYNLTIPGIHPSIAVEVDTYSNGWDPDRHHVSVLADGIVSPALRTEALPDPVVNEGPRWLWVRYENADKTLRVWVSTTSTPDDEPLISLPIAVPERLGDRVFVGVSAGTGGAASDHDIERLGLTVWEP